MKLRYVSRRPTYPVVCEVLDDAVCAHTREQLEERLGRFNLSNVERLQLVDAEGSGWEVYLPQQIVAPSFDKRRWTKDELLHLYRNSKVGQSDGLPISENAAKRKSVPDLVGLIVDWLSAGPKRPKSSGNSDVRLHGDAQLTAEEGQYLSFIYYYTKIHRAAPAETDMQRYFEVSASMVRRMISTLESKGLIEKTPGKARSIRLLVSREVIPDLE